MNFLNSIFNKPALATPPTPQEQAGAEVAKKYRELIDAVDNRNDPNLLRFTKLLSDYAVAAGLNEQQRTEVFRQANDFRQARFGVAGSISSGSPIFDQSVRRLGSSIDIENDFRKTAYSLLAGRVPDYVSAEAIQARADAAQRLAQPRVTPTPGPVPRILSVPPVRVAAETGVEASRPVIEDLSSPFAEPSVAVGQTLASEVPRAFSHQPRVREIDARQLQRHRLFEPLVEEVPDEEAPVVEAPVVPSAESVRGAIDVAVQESRPEQPSSWQEKMRAKIGSGVGKLFGRFGKQ